LSDDEIHLAAQLLDSLIALSSPNPHKRDRLPGQMAWDKSPGQIAGTDRPQ
jgi:hypothetical protein